MSNTFTVTIKKKEESYTIEAKGQKGIKVDPQPAPQLKDILSDEQIKNTLKSLANEQGLATPSAIQKLGEALYSALFIKLILLAFGKAQGRAKADNLVRLRLRIEPPELAALPWETLYDGQGWLSSQSTTPLVRQLILEPGSKTLQKLQVRRALKILFVGASPEDLDNLNIEKTASELKELLEESIKKKKIVFDVILNATLKELQEELVKDYHILYFAGHGSPEGIFLDDGEGDDLIEGDRVVGRGRGDKYFVNAETLAQALEGKQTRLVFLAACETSKTVDESGLLRGFAQELAQRSELPAIVAMQYFISDRQANPLTTQFFAALAAGNSVDVALAEARKTLISKGTVGRDVFSPVLYLQAEDGRLFQKPKPWPVISLSVLLVIAMLIVGGFARTSEIGKINNSIIEAKQDLESNQILDAQLKSLWAGKKIKHSFWQKILPEPGLRNQVLGLLHRTIYRGREINRLEGHTARVTSVAISLDGQTIASASADNKVKLWTIQGEEITTFSGHDDDVLTVAISPDGQTIASGGRGGKVKLWTVQGKEIASFTFRVIVHSIAFSPDGRTIVVAGGDVKLYDLQGNELRTFTRNQFESVAFSPDGETIAASNGFAKTINLWNLQGETIKTITGHTARVTSVAFSPDGQTIASASTDGSVKLWSLQGEEIQNLTVQADPLFADEIQSLTGQANLNLLNSVAFSPDGQTIASGGYDHTIKLWNLQGKEIETLTGHGGGVLSLAFSQDGTLASSSWDSTVKLWNLKKENEAVKTLEGHGDIVNSVAFSPNGQILASGSYDSTIRLWNLQGEDLNITMSHEDTVHGVAFSPDGETLASASADDTVKLWNLQGEEIETFIGHSDGVWSVAFSPDGKTLASGSSDKTIKLWDLQNKKEIKTFNKHSNAVVNVAFSPDGKMLASGSWDSTVKLWDLHKEKEIETFTTGNLGFHSVVFSPDGKTLAAGNGDQTVWLWKLNLPGDNGKSLRRHRDNVYSVAFSPDGKMLASGSYDKTLRLWNLQREQIGILRGGESRVTSVAFSPDGQMFASGHHDWTVKLWSWDLDNLLKLNCNKVRDYLKYNDNVEENKHLCGGIGT